MKEALSTKVLSGRQLYKEIFDSDNPEQFVKTVPAQSLYLSLKERGIESSLELIEILPIPAFRTFLDFDLWEKDDLHEDNIWEWLRLTDEEEPLKFVQKFLKSVDLKIIALLITKYVKVVMFDHASENPPAPHWSTPDKGYTWLHVETDNDDIFFYFNRFLALLFETSAELFYQLIAIPGVSTQTQLEEEAYQDKVKRLAADGLPDDEFCIQLNAVLMPYQAKEILCTDIQTSSDKIADIPIIDSLVHISASSIIEPLDRALLTVSDTDSLLAELTLILNASLQFFAVPFYEFDTVSHHAKKVRGAINIGLERACQFEGITAEVALRKLGLGKLYRLGLFFLLDLRKLSKSVTIDEIKALQEDPIAFSLFAHTREAFPEHPTEPSGSRPFEHLEEINSIKEKIQTILSKKES